MEKFINSVVEKNSYFLKDKSPDMNLKLNFRKLLLEYIEFLKNSDPESDIKIDEMVSSAIEGRNKELLPNNGKLNFLETALRNIFEKYFEDVKTVETSALPENIIPFVRKKNIK